MQSSDLFQRLDALFTQFLGRRSPAINVQQQLLTLGRQFLGDRTPFVAAFVHLLNSIQTLHQCVEPLIRGRAMMELLAHLDEFELGLDAAVRDHVPASDLEVLDKALPTDWIRASHTRPVIDGIVAELRERAPELWSSLVTARLFPSPMLRTFVEAVVRIGGLSPTRFLKAMPRGWNNAYKDWCDPKLAGSGSRTATVEFSQVAPYLFEHRQHWIAIEGVLCGLVAAAKEEGRVVMRFFPASKLVRAEVSW